MIPSVTTILAILRRLGAIGGTAVLALILGNLQEWVKAAAEGKLEGAWLIVIYLGIEALQKYARAKGWIKA